jgi:hypothetical protein
MNRNESQVEQVDESQIEQIDESQIRNQHKNNM